MARKRETSLPTGFGFGPPRAVAQRPGSRAAPPEGNAAEPLTIGEVAERFAVTLRTLRFYEQRGLIAPARSGATRLYGPRELARLAVILKGKTLGFTLQEIEVMLDDEAPKTGALRLSPDQVREQIAHLERQKAEIEEALAALRGY